MYVHFIIMTQILFNTSAHLFIQTELYWTGLFLWNTDLEPIRCLNFTHPGINPVIET